MGERYTSKDILEMAVQAKERGVDLYLALARNSENYHVGKLFMELAKDEQRHKLELTRRFETLKAGNDGEAYPGERALFLKALVEENTFNCGAALKKALETTIDEEDALRAGVDFEKDFMLFLHELKRYVAKDEEKTVDALIGEEIRHIGEIIRIKDKLSGKK